MPQGEGKNVELLDGELIEMGRPGWRRFRIRQRFHRSLDPHLEMTGSGLVCLELEFCLGPRRRLVPDLSVLLNGRWEGIGEETSVVRAIPDLVIEIVFPSESAHHVDVKTQGVSEVLTVFPAQKHVQKFCGIEIRDCRLRHAQDRIAARLAITTPRAFPERLNLDAC